MVGQAVPPVQDLQWPTALVRPEHRCLIPSVRVPRQVSERANLHLLFKGYLIFFFISFDHFVTMHCNGLKIILSLNVIFMQDIYGKLFHSY